jgi:hypothetical protein
MLWATSRTESPGPEIASMVNEIAKSSVDPSKQTQRTNFFDQAVHKIRLRHGGRLPKSWIKMLLL